MSRHDASKYSEQLTPVPEADWPPSSPTLLKVWVSKKYLVQLYDERLPAYPTLLRLSISRVVLNQKGRWQDGLTWDELQLIKRDVGFADWYALEIYPRDCDIVNVSNMRHLWMIDRPLQIGWSGN